VVYGASFLLVACCSQQERTIAPKPELFRNGDAIVDIVAKLLS